MKIKDTVHFEWYKHLFIALLLLAFLYASIVSTDANFEQLAGNIGQVGVFLKKLAHPQFSYLPKLVDPMVKTLKMSALGTALGILLAIPFAFLATTVVTDNRIITGVCRFFLNVIRTIPNLLLASLLVAIVGIGEATGVLTIAIFTFGMASQLIFESIETIDLSPVEAATAVGANKLKVAVWAIWPQITSSVVSYTFYAFELNVRASTVLGYVGAGGIGVKLNEALGLFKYIAVADVLNMVVDTVFPHYADYSAPMLILTAVMYTFYLYFSFSGYSEISRATGLVLGLDLPENFKTPFYATNFSGFWSRWHISFSSWLQDYLFMPLAWADLGRFGRLPTELCVFCVFFASGFWHGSTAPFIIWGLLQAVYRVGEELLHRRFGKPKKRGTPARVLWGKRVVVFVLWTISMVFFRVGSGNLSGMAENLGVGDAFVYLGRCLMNSWSPARFAGELYSTAYTGFYANTIMVAAYWAFAALALALGIWLDHRRNFACKNKPAEVALASAKHRNALYVVLIVFILVGYIMQSGGFNANAFGPYAGF